MDRFLTYLLISFFPFFTSETVGQTKGEIYVNSLNDSSYYLGSSSPKKALNIAEKSIALSKRIGYQKGEIMAYCRKGNALVETGELNAALSSYETAEKLFNKSSVDSIILAKIFIYKASIYRRKGMVDWALSMNKHSFDIAVRQQNPSIMSSAAINMSLIHKEKGHYKKALMLLHRAIRILPEQNHEEFGVLYNCVGNIYQDEGRFKEAINAYSLALSHFRVVKNLHGELKVTSNIGNCFWDLDEPDSAVTYYKKALPLSIKHDFKETEGILYQNLGATFAEKRNLDSSMFYYTNSLAIKENSGDLDGSLETLKSIGEIYFIKNDVDSAIDTYQRAYKLALSFEYIEDLEHITRELSACYQKKDDWDQAYHYLELSKDYRDSISDELNDALIYEVNFEQAQKKLVQLELEANKREAVLERRNFMYIMTVILAVLLSIIFFILSQRNKQKRKVAEIAKEKIQKEKEISELIRKQEQVELSAMFDGQEVERNRIALELHDKLGGLLSVVKLYFKSIDEQINKLKKENIEQYQKANVLLDEACDETRKIAHQLSSKSLGRVGLFATVKKMQDQINDAGQIAFTLNTHGTDEHLKALNQISIYRIIQELVNNILKHAIATEINVQLNVFDELFNMIVEDDGIGFNFNQMINNTGIGLQETEARIKHMNGTFSIDSGRGAGTTVTIDIPLNKET